MADSIYDWSSTASSNATADGGINWQEGMPPSAVNDSARMMMKRLRDFVSDIGGGLTAGGSANALTLTTATAFSTYADGRVVAFKAAADNTGAATLNANGIGAKSLRKVTQAGEAALASGDIQQDGIYLVQYSSVANGAAGGWFLINPTQAIVTLTGTETLTNKTLTSPVLTTPRINDTSADHKYILAVSELAADRTITLPLLAGNDTFVFAAFTQTLTNKTLTSPTINNPTVTGLDASESARGLVELATTAEASAGTDTDRAVTPAGLAAAIPVAVSNIAFGARGSYTFAYYSGTSGLTEGSTISGSSLQPAGFWSTTDSIANDTSTSVELTKGGSGLTGTWRIMSRANVGVGNTDIRAVAVLRTL